MGIFEHRLRVNESINSVAITIKFYRKRNITGRQTASVLNMLPFKHPFTCIVSGPTQCGILKLTSDAQVVIEPSPERIVYCYGEYQHAFDTVRNRVHFHEGLPDVKQFDGRLRTLLILEPRAVAVSPYGWLMTHYGWLAS